MHVGTPIRGRTHRIRTNQRAKMPSGTSKSLMAILRIAAPFLGWITVLQFYCPLDQLYSRLVI